jgi:hypothetical protein
MQPFKMMSALGVLGFFIVTCAGCGQSTPQSKTADEVAVFKGDPSKAPPDVQKMIAESRSKSGPPKGVPTKAR